MGCKSFIGWGVLAAVGVAATAAGCGTPTVPAEDPIAMVEVPGGTFLMGCDPVDDPACADDESPMREVFLGDFEIAQYEVTQAQYRDCMVDQQCSAPKCDWNPVERGDYPVACVNWVQADEFCTWAGMKLPSEAQWEKAARGDDGRIYPWGDAEPTCDTANFLGCGGLRLPVGSKPAGVSPYGIHDMAGNVPEWVADWYQDDYYEFSPIQDPGGPEDGDYRVFRGGSFATFDAFLRTSDRAKDEPGDFAVAHLAYFGIRCAR